MHTQYLYGASVQGIQGFIFETNKLTEIAGASELVEQICTTAFFDLARITDPDRDPQLQLAAAGNIKYLFQSREACERVVREFPRHAMQMAPGVTVSQAVVKIEGAFAAEYSNMLEQKLRAQRNRPPAQHGLGWMVSERSRRTGKPGVESERDGRAAIDSGQHAKRKAVKPSKRSLLSKLMPETRGKGYDKHFASEIEDISGGVEKGWIAIIHADGNDLGKKIMKMAEGNATSKEFREMSRKLEAATTSAAQTAFGEVVRGSTKQSKYPIRPIVLGGDDLTVIIRGDLALRFTETFLQAFELETRKQFQGFGFGFDQGLTACAGIAYIKPNYPFHYGADLAETLCGQAKKVAKSFKEERTPSCLQFHKVHASFIEDYSSIIAKELTAGDIRLDYGPYFLEAREGYATAQDLQKWIKLLKEPNSPRSRLRNWLSDLQVNSEAAGQQLDRIRQITDGSYVRDLKLSNPFTQRNQQHTHLFDAIALSAIESPQQ
ncbi:MAG: hypothetical protein OHK0039_10260 [Bacteroidia bacterium]